MKAIVAIFLLLLFSVQTFSKWMWVLDYQLNKAYIATHLCVNKTKPMQHCNGKCQLTKKLVEDENGNRKDDNTASKQNSETLFFTHEPTVMSNAWCELHQSWPVVDLLRHYHAPLTAVFHPPAV